MPAPPRFNWKTFFTRSSTAVFVVGGDRRLRYANLAFERTTGETLARIRGTKISRLKSAMALGQVLAPPAEAWLGKSSRVRRAAPGGVDGPPWWDLQFLPLMGEGTDRPLGMIGILNIVGATKPLPRVPLPANAAQLRERIAAAYSLDLFEGPSSASQRLATQVRTAAIGEMPVWLCGEAGSGEETVARAIHHNGPRRERTFFGVACGGLQPYLIEGLLFGKGGLAATGRLGTLFLKSPELLPRPLQQRLLNWCELAAGPRLISSSSETPEELARKGSLASEFATKYSAFEIRIPPLRERLEDLPLAYSRRCEGVLPHDVSEAFRKYRWPGNWREFWHVVNDLGSPPSVQNLPRFLQESAKLLGPPPKQNFNLDETLRSVEQRLIRLALAKAGGKLGLAAERVGLTRAALRRRLAGAPE